MKIYWKWPSYQIRYITLNHHELETILQCYFVPRRPRKSYSLKARTNNNVYNMHKCKTFTHIENIFRFPIPSCHYVIIIMCQFNSILFIFRRRAIIASILIHFGSFSWSIQRTYNSYVFYTIPYSRVYTKLRKVSGTHRVTRVMYLRYLHFSRFTYNKNRCLLSAGCIEGTYRRNISSLLFLGPLPFPPPRETVGNNHIYYRR